MNPSFTVVLRRGLLAGLAAGLASALALLLLVEPQIRSALAIEESRPVAGEAHEDMFSRPVQVLGGALAVLVVSLAIGTLFAVAFARLRHRLPAGTDFGRSVQLASAGYLVVALLPGLKYPANPPGVGDPGTVNQRTLAYLSFILAGILVVYGLSELDRLLRSKDWAGPVRSMVIIAVALVAFGAMLALWPANPDTTPADIPAALLWQFRLASLAQLGALWLVLGCIFGLLNDRSTAERPAAATAAGTVGV